MSPLHEKAYYFNGSLNQREYTWSLESWHEVWIVIGVRCKPLTAAVVSFGGHLVGDISSTEQQEDRV